MKRYSMLDKVRQDYWQSGDWVEWAGVAHIVKVKAQLQFHSKGKE